MPKIIRERGGLRRTFAQTEGAATIADSVPPAKVYTVRSGVATVHCTGGSLAVVLANEAGLSLGEKIVHVGAKANFSCEGEKNCILTITNNGAEKSRFTLKGNIPRT